MYVTKLGSRFHVHVIWNRIPDTRNRNQESEFMKRYSINMINKLSLMNYDLGVTISTRIFMIFFVYNINITPHLKPLAWKPPDDNSHGHIVAV